MKALFNIFSLLLGLILIGCHKQPSEYSPFANFDFTNGNYKLYGFISEGGGSDFCNTHKDFYIDSKEVLNNFKNTWIFDSTSKRMPCGWEYDLCLTSNDSLLLTLRINSECKYLISDTWYEFNPDLWGKISVDKIVHLDRDTAQFIRERLFDKQNIKKSKPKILVLPPYDEIANEGISPRIQNYLENLLDSVETIQLIKFPLKDLMNISYQNVYDKKYCQPIIEKVKSDYIIMSKLELEKKTGDKKTDKWGFSIKIYDINKNFQWESLSGNDMTSDSIANYLSTKTDTLLIKLTKR